MHNSAFEDANIAGSTVLNGCNVYIQYGDSQSGRPNTDFSDAQETHLETQLVIQDSSSSQAAERPRIVTFAEGATTGLRNSSAGWSEIPPNISRLRSTREKSPDDQAPGSAHSISSSYSVSGRTTTTTTPLSYFKAVEENRDTLEDHLNQRVKDSSIRGYMKSQFFHSPTAIPLWEPSPGCTSPDGIMTSSVCVGDVGFFTSGGGFYVLFNAFLSYTENKNIDFDPPHDFEPYPVRFVGDVSVITEIPYPDYDPFYGDFEPDAEIPHHSERTYISSYHLLKKKPKTLRSGTLLDLPNGFWRDQMHHRAILAMQGHFARHAESWYNYYLKQPDSGRTIPKGHLHIVTGSYKCSAWALAHCSTSSAEDVFARLYKIYPDSEFFYQWDRRGPIDGKKGPQSAKFGKDGLPLKNHCVAVEVYSIVKTKHFQKKARASASTIMSGLKRGMSTLSLIWK